MSQKAMDHMARNSEEEPLLYRPQQMSHQITHPPPPQYGHSSVQVPGNAFIGPYQGAASSGVPQHQQPYPHGGVNQMQQQVVVVGQQPQQPQTIVAPRPWNAYTWHIVLSCIVFWLCGWIFGAIAFALAVHAGTYSAAGRLTGARRLGNASVVVSVLGMLVGVAFLSVVITLVVVKDKCHHDG